MNREDFDAAISRGIALLDEKAGADWYSAKRLPLARLDLGSMDCCVCGLLYRSYGLGLYTLKIRSGANYGFDFATCESREAYDALTDAWKARVKQLRRERKGRH